MKKQLKTSQICPNFLLSLNADFGPFGPRGVNDHVDCRECVKVIYEAYIIFYGQHLSQNVIGLKENSYGLWAHLIPNSTK